MEPSSSKVGKAWGVMGHGVKHHRGSDPRPAGHEGVVSVQASNELCPVQWPSTVQVVAEGPGLTPATVWLQKLTEEFTWIHLGTERGKLMVDTKTWPGRPMV